MEEKIRITQSQFMDFLEQTTKGLGALTADMFVLGDSENVKLIVKKIEVQFLVIQEGRKGVAVGSVQRTEDGGYVFN